MENVALVREICNGIMATTAVITFIVFAEYLCRYLYNKKTWQSITFQAAVAIEIMMVGHFIRAGTSWAGFIMERLGYVTIYGAVGQSFATPLWINSGWIFALATAFIVVGKLMVILAFAPDDIYIYGHRISWRTHLKVAYVFAILLPFWVGTFIH